LSARITSLSYMQALLTRFPKSDAQRTSAGRVHAVGLFGLGFRASAGLDGRHLVCAPRPNAETRLWRHIRWGETGCLAA
jgi:hypothetical protein